MRRDLSGWVDLNCTHQHGSRLFSKVGLRGESDGFHVTSGNDSECRKISLQLVKDPEIPHTKCYGHPSGSSL